MRWELKPPKCCIIGVLAPIRCLKEESDFCLFWERKEFSLHSLRTLEGGRNTTAALNESVTCMTIFSIQLTRGYSESHCNFFCAIGRESRYLTHVSGFHFGSLRNFYFATLDVTIPKSLLTWSICAAEKNLGQHGWYLLGFMELRFAWMYSYIVFYIQYCQVAEIQNWLDLQWKFIV